MYPFIITVCYDTCHPHLREASLLRLRKQALCISFPAYQAPFIDIEKPSGLALQAEVFLLSSRRLPLGLCIAKLPP